jgi:hypothetical protein
VEYSIFSFIFATGFTVIYGQSSETDIKLQQADSLYGLYNSNFVVPSFRSNENNKVGAKDGSDYPIDYVGTLAFQFQKEYTFVGTTNHAYKGDILQFAFTLAQAKFNVGCIKPQTALNNT